MNIFTNLHKSSQLYRMIFFIPVFMLNVAFAQSQCDSLRKNLLNDPDNPEKLNELAGNLLEDSIEESVFLANEALDISLKNNNIPEQARANSVLGNAAWYQQDFKSSITYCTKAADLFLEANLRLDAAQAYNDMALAAYEIDRFQDALDYYRKSLKLLLKEDNDENIPAVLSNMGQVYQGTGQMDSAIYFYERAIALCEAPGKEEELCAAYGNLGYAYKKTGNFEKALEYYIKAYKISIEMGSDENLATDFNNIAALYVAWEKYEPAVDYFRQALETDYREGNMAKAEITLNNLAYVYQQLGKLDSALILFKKSEAIAENLGRYGNAAIREINIGMLYYELKQYNTAISYLKKGLGASRQLDRNDVVAGGLQNLGACYLALGNSGEAQKYLDEALTLALDMNLKPILQKIYENRSNLFEKLGKPQPALDAFRKYVAVKDSLFSEKNQQTITEMQTRYETEKKQEQIQILIRDGQLREAEIRKKQLIMTGLIGSVLFLAAIAVIIILLYLQKSRAHRKLVEQTLELMKRDEDTEMKTDIPINLINIRDEEKERIIQELEKLVKAEKLFSDSRLSMNNLAEKLGTNTTYLSKVINDHYDVNFSNYLNQYRVREAQKMFARNVHHTMTLEGIAGNVGFHSRSAFNTAFKKFTGVTPSIFIKNMESIQKSQCQ